MAAVRLDKVAKVYEGGVTAVHDLDLHVSDGEFLVLVGPSGCGKSTTLRMIAGLESISRGTLRIGDHVVNDVPPRDRDIAMVFQNYALYPHMTVEQNLAFALKMRRTHAAEIAERVRWAAELLGLEPLLTRKPRELSGGQRQRVALGRAIVRKPAVFLFDEPLSNLDAKLRVQTRAEIKRLHRQLGVTAIYVTHDQEEAMTLGDRVAVMHEGYLRQCDAPLNIYNRPADRFVAGFLGMPPMNFLEGRLAARDDRCEFEAGRLKLPLPDEARGLARRGVSAVVAGIRPEACRLLQPGASAPHRFAAEVQLVEPLGSTMDVFLQTDDGARLVARTAAAPLAEGSRVELAVDPEQIRLFDAPSAAAGGAFDAYGSRLL
jgi:multiple sugar transport system ATP-binding protein